LKKNIKKEVVKVFKPFLEFLKAFKSHQIHIMLAVMLDPCFKSLSVVESFVGCGNAICLAIEYDMKEVILLLMTIFHRLNPIVEVIIAPCDEPAFQIEEEDNNMFNVRASMEESSWALVTTKLSLFRRLFIPPSMCVDPFVWWQTHEGYFPNVVFLAKQILGIFNSQIETKMVFNLVGVLIALGCYHLEMKILDKIIIVVKN